METDQRKLVRLAKAKTGCDFKYVANYLDISYSSMYNWLNYQFELSRDKQNELDDLLDVLLDRIEY